MIHVLKIEDHLGAPFSQQRKEGAPNPINLRRPQLPLQVQNRHVLIGLKIQHHQIPKLARSSMDSAIFEWDFSNSVSHRPLAQISIRFTIPTNTTSRSMPA